MLLLYVGVSIGVLLFIILVTFLGVLQFRRFRLSKPQRKDSIILSYGKSQPYDPSRKILIPAQTPPRKNVSLEHKPNPANRHIPLITIQRASSLESLMCQDYAHYGSLKRELSASIASLDNNNHFISPSSGGCSVDIGIKWSPALRRLTVRIKDLSSLVVPPTKGTTSFGVLLEVFSADKNQKEKTITSDMGRQVWTGAPLELLFKDINANKIRHGQLVISMFVRKRKHIRNKMVTKTTLELRDVDLEPEIEANKSLFLETQQNHNGEYRAEVVVLRGGQRVTTHEAHGYVDENSEWNSSFHISTSETLLTKHEMVITVAKIQGSRPVKVLGQAMFGRDIPYKDSWTKVLSKKNKEVEFTLGLLPLSKHRHEDIP